MPFSLHSARRRPACFGSVSYYTVSACHVMPCLTEVPRCISWRCSSRRNEIVAGHGHKYLFCWMARSFEQSQVSPGVCCTPLATHLLPAWCHANGAGIRYRACLCPDLAAGVAQSMDLSLRNSWHSSMHASNHFSKAAYAGEGFWPISGDGYQISSSPS